MIPLSNFYILSVESLASLVFFKNKYILKKYFNKIWYFLYINLNI